MPLWTFKCMLIFYDSLNVSLGSLVDTKIYLYVCVLIEYVGMYFGSMWSMDACESMHVHIYVYIHVDARAQCQVPFFISLHLISWNRHFHWTWCSPVGSGQGAARVLCAPPTQHQNHVCILPRQASYMSAEDPNTNLHACLASTLRSEPPPPNILYVNQIKLQLNYLCNTWIRIKLWLSSILYLS